MEWEEIDLYLYRTRIPGGWLVKHESDVLHNNEYHGMIGGWDSRTSICFVPDEGHYWIILKKDGA